MQYYLPMSKKQETPFIYFEAKPKFGRQAVVDKTIGDLVGLFAEIYHKRANANLLTEQTASGAWTILVRFESEQARDMLEQDARFQELITDLRVYCKRVHRLRRMVFAILHPGQRLAAFTSTPIGPM
jgi:hypothetical protein